MQMNSTLLAYIIPSLVILFALAYTSSLLAKSRNHSPYLWFFLTLVFPFAILFIASKDTKVTNNYNLSELPISNFNTFTALWTLTIKEVRRFLRIWIQTLVPPAVTMSLYFVIFGSLIGPRIGSMDGFDYIQFRGAMCLTSTSDPMQQPICTSAMTSSGVSTLSITPTS